MTLSAGARVCGIAVTCGLIGAPTLSLGAPTLLFAVLIAPAQAYNIHCNGVFLAAVRYSKIFEFFESVRLSPRQCCHFDVSAVTVTSVLSL